MSRALHDKNEEQNYHYDEVISPVKFRGFKRVRESLTLTLGKDGEKDVRQTTATIGTEKLEAHVVKPEFKLLQTDLSKLKPITTSINISCCICLSLLRLLDK